MYKFIRSNPSGDQLIHGCLVGPFTPVCSFKGLGPT